MLRPSFLTSIEENMKKAMVAIVLLIIFILLFGWTVGSFARWFYYTVMVIFSKLTFAIMYGLVILGLLLMLLPKGKKDDK